MCPGERLADDSLFVAIAMTLHLFSIGPPRDADGHGKPPNLAYTPGTIRYGSRRLSWSWSRLII